MTPVGDGMRIAWPVKASTTIYAGTYLCIEEGTGYARPCANGLSNPRFLGVAIEDADNSSGANGAISVDLYRHVEVEESVTGISAITAVGEEVYAEDDATLNGTGTNDVFVGRVSFYDAALSKSRVICKAEHLIDLAALSTS
jgi:hypothetical protein